MRIAFVSREFPPSKRSGGIATYVWESSRYLSGQGHKVFIIAASDDILHGSSYSADDVTVIRLPGGDFFIGEEPALRHSLQSHYRRLRYFRSYRRLVAKKLKELVSDHSIDLVEFAEYGNEALFWACERPSIPWVVRLHGPTLLDNSSGKAFSAFKAPLKWSFGKLEMTMLSKATAITAPSRAIAEKVAQIAGLRASEITVVPNAIDMANWKSAAIKGSDCKSSFRIFSAGTIVSAKGFGDLVTAVGILRERGFNIVLELAGKHGRLGKDLARAQSRGNKKDWLYLLGAVPRTQLAELYSRADIVVLPSWWESFGLVCIEAMASGALVVGSSSGGMAEIIKENESGFLIEPRDSDLLADKIEQIIKLPSAEKERIRANAVVAVNASYSVQNVMAEQIELYQKIIERNQMRRGGTCGS